MEESEVRNFADAIPPPYALILVGVIPAPRDLEITRLLGWYRIPYRFAPKVVQVDYLAFYQPSSFEKGHDGRIEYFAEVRGVELTTRGELIKEERKVLKRCSSCGDPVERQRVPEFYSADLLGTQKCKWSEFVDGFMFDDLVVSGRLRDLLAKSGLKGYGLRAIEIECDQTGSERAPELSCLIATGKHCYRERKISVPEPNTCPFCGTGPVVCPTCKRLVGCRSCINCKRKIVFYDDEKVDQCETRCFLTESLMDNEPIIEGAKWDGSDFLRVQMGVRYVVTARTIDFFCQNDVRRFAAWPIAVNIEGMSDEQTAALTTCHFARG